MKLLIQLKSFSVKCKRVWHSLKKPSRKELETIAKVSAIGILILGVLWVYNFYIYESFCLGNSSRNPRKNFINPNAPINIIIL